MVTMCAPACLHNIALGRSGRLAGRWAYTLHVDDNDRNLRCCSVADQLLLQGNTRAGGGSQSLLACQRSTQYNAHAGNLVLHLDELAANLRQELCHALGNFCGRGNRIAAEETDTGCQSTLGTCLITLHQSSFTHFATFLSTKIA